MSSISLRNITKRYGAGSQFVLRDVSLDVEDGEFLTLLGPSGCGKSTLLRIIAGLEQQDSGSIHIDGRPVDELRPSERDVAMVFQSHALYPHLTVAENIALPLKMRRLRAYERILWLDHLLPIARATRKRIEEDVARVAAICEIDQLLDRKPHALSGGQCQRVALARAMVRQPAVFLMDEPLSSLDTALKVSLRAQIKALRRQLAATVIYVTHDHVEAMTLSDRIAVLLDGGLQQVGRPQAIYTDPDSLAVARILGAPKINSIAAVAKGGCKLMVGAEELVTNVPIQAATRVVLGIRPEAFVLSASRLSGALSGRITLLENHGCDTFIYVEVSGLREILVARAPSSSQFTLTAGDPVFLTARPENILVFDEAGFRQRPPVLGCAPRPLQQVQ